MNRSDSGRRRWLGRRKDRTETSRPAVPAPETAGSPTGSAEEGPGAGERLLVEEYDGLRLLRTLSDDSLSDTDISDLARAFSADRSTVTVMTGADAARSAELWTRLGALLDELRADGIREVRLVMTAAGDDRPGAPALGRRIADSWDLDVIAPDGLSLAVPGGGLFVPARHPGAAQDTGSGVERGNWWRFPPRAEPQLVGARQPAPAWQQSVDALPARIAGGCAVDRIPAGVLARSADAAPPRLGDLCYAVPADPHGPTLLLGVPEGGDVPTDSVLELLAALPEPVRRQVRLAPGGPRDILPTGQAVSDALGAELVVYTGMPLMAPGSTGGPARLRSVLIGADGAPRWQAFLDAVMCLPAEPNAPPRMPRPLRWSQFVANRTTVDRALTEHGVVPLSDRWRATGSRAGVYVSDSREEQPPAVTRPTEADGPSIEVGRPGQVLDGTLPAALGTLLAGLDPDVRSRARLLVHGTSQDGGRELRRTAAEHGLRSIRLQPSKPAAPASAAGHGAAPANGSANGAAPSAARTSEREAEQPGSRPHPPMPQTPPDHAAPAAASAAARPAAYPSGEDAPEFRPPPGFRAGTRTASAPAPRRSDAERSGAAAPREAAAEVTGQLAAADVPERSERPAGAEPVSGSAPSSGGASPVEPFPPMPAVPPTTAPGPSPGPASPPGTPDDSIAPVAGPVVRPEPAEQPEPAGPPASEHSGPATAVRHSRESPDSREAGPVTAGTSAPETGAVPEGVRPEAAPDAPARPGTPPPSPTPQSPPPAPKSAAGPEAQEGATLPPEQSPEARKVEDPTEPAAVTTPVPATTHAGFEGATPTGETATPAESTEPAPARPAERPEEPIRATDPEQVGEPAAPTAPPAPPAPPVPSARRTAASPDDGDGPAPAPAGPLPPVPFLPGHASTPGERTAVRRLAAASWERHASAVTRALTRMPALRGPQQEDVIDDLIALHAYLNSTEGPLSHEELDRGLRTGEQRMLSYAACVASALRRLPSHRGLAFRGTDTADAGLEPGNLLREPGPVGALPLGTGAPRPGGPQYAIWSATGRRVRELTGGRAGSRRRDEVVFSPGSLLRVLEVRDQQGAPLVLLREVPVSSAPGGAGSLRQSTELDDQDRAALERLDQALRRHPLTPGPFQWPGLCAGALGRNGDASDGF